MLFQLSDRHEAVHRIAGEAADRLGHDQIDLPGKGILDHLIESFPVAGIGSADAFVRIHLHKFPFRMRLDVPGVVVYLSLITGELFIGIRTDTCISCDLPLCNTCYGGRCENVPRLRDFSHTFCHVLASWRSLRPSPSFPASSFWNVIQAAIEFSAPCRPSGERSAGPGKLL